MDKIQEFKIDEFHYSYTKILTNENFSKEMEEIYNNRYKANYEEKGFRKGHVPFDKAILNGELASGLLQTVALVNRQIFVEELLNLAKIRGSIYDIVDGEEQTSFEEFDLSTEEPIIMQLVVELASFVEEVDLEGIKINKDEIRTKEYTNEEIEELFKEYKKVKDPQNKATKTSFVELEITDNTDVTTITIDMGLKLEDIDEELKKKTQTELSEALINKSTGYKFEYDLMGDNGQVLKVEVTVKDVYRVKTLTDDEFVNMLKEDGASVDITIKEVKDLFVSHINDTYQENLDAEIKALTFATLAENAKGIKYNEKEIENLKAQFYAQVRKFADDEGVTYEEFVKENFGTMDSLDRYVDSSEKARVLNAAIYRKVGEGLNILPTEIQLEGFVRKFLFKVDGSEDLGPEFNTQLNAEVERVLGEPLNRQRLVETWIAVKGEEEVERIINKQLA